MFSGHYQSRSQPIVFLISVIHFLIFLILCYKLVILNCCCCINLLLCEVISFICALFYVITRGKKFIIFSTSMTKRSTSSSCNIVCTSYLLHLCIYLHAIKRTSSSCNAACTSYQSLSVSSTAAILIANIHASFTPIYFWKPGHCSSIFCISTNFPNMFLFTDVIKTGSFSM